MKNLNLTLSLTEAGKCATKLAQGIDGPVYAMKMQNGKYICGLSFIIAIAGRSAFGDEFDTNATYEAAYCTGYTNGGIYHAWNAIVYNGEITYIDSTYNASGNHMAYFCRNKEDLKERTENSIIWFSASDD